MSQFVDIDTDNAGSNFVLKGDVENILKNTRLVFSLKRLLFKREGEKVLIPFEEKTKIKTLQELHLLLDKFSLIPKLSDKTQNEVSSFDREQKTFREFSEKAKDIRNDSFKDKPELVADFDTFQKTVKEKLARPLYPLQLLSAFHMAFSQNACNFAVPGSGKTSIVYGAYAYLKSLPKDNPKHIDKLLVIGPLSSFAPWEKEYQACFRRKVESQRLSGDYTILRAHKEEHLYSGNPAELTLISHGGVNILQNEIVAFLKKNKTMVVVDEAHRIKNPDGVWGRSAVEIAKEAKSRIVLTGTPVPNGYEDLYNLFQYLYPFKFKEILKFHLPNLEDMTKNPDEDRVKEFTDNISPYFIRIKKADLKLPPIKEQTVEVEMDSDQREIYDFIETRYVKSFQSDGSASVKDFLNRAKLIRLRQAATNPALLLKPLAEAFDVEDDQSMPSINGQLPDEFQEDSHVLSKIRNYSKHQKPRKFTEIKKLFETKIFPSNGKVIVWSIFIQNAKGLQSYLDANGISSRLLIGEVEQSEREQIIDEFNDPANFNFRVVIANPFAVSESISLHKGCHNAIYMERDYNCASFLQSKDRIHRYGLPPNQITEYFYLVSTGSIDEVIDDRLRQKIKRMEKIIDDDIPLFARINDLDETDLIKALLIDYAKRA
jgi:SNF2 family DNA or RNA helicase